jgi:SAM-dependent methyltransferase
VRTLIPISIRAQVMSRVGSNQLFRRLTENTGELDVMKAEMKRLAPGERWHEFRAGLTTVRMTERVVEIPWALSRYQGEQRVLDLGPAYAVTWYTRYLTRLGIVELHGFDLKPVRIKGMTVGQGDMRQMPYPDGYFDLIICISTLEHVGRENRDHYGVAGQRQDDGDLQALRELRRVLAPTGRVLITEPFGRLQHLSWMKQYDLSAWNELLERAGFSRTELALYEYSDRGWSLKGQPTGAETNLYQDHGAPAATAVLCASITLA